MVDVDAPPKKRGRPAKAPLALSAPSPDPRTEAQVEGAKKLRRPRAGAEAMAERARLHECRVEYVADLMRDLKFRTGVTNEALAVEWDLPKGYVGKITLEASRRVRAELTDHDRVLSKITRALDWVIDDALASGDRHAMIKAAQVWAQVAGAGAALRVEVAPDLSALSPEQIKARKEELIRRLAGAPALEKAEGVEITVLPEGDE